MLNLFLMETSQMLKEHPIKNEHETYRIRYINMLEYFVNTYSPGNPWSIQSLRLYKKELLNNKNECNSSDFNLKKDSKYVLGTKFHPFEFYTYRYAFMIDCLFICSYDDQEKSKLIYNELSSIYSRSSQKKSKTLFDSLYDLSISTIKIDKIEYLKKCWDTNRSFIKNKPIKVIISANMSAGKSTLLNAIVGKKVNKTQNDTCTAKIHYIMNKPYEDGYCYEQDYLLELDADYDTLMDDNKENSSSDIVVGCFFRMPYQKSERLQFIDTPGVNSSQNSEHKALSEKTICNSDADLLIYLMNGENIGTDDDRKHLMFILKNYHGKVLFAVNKLDRFRKRDDSIADTLKSVVTDLTNMGFKNPNVVPISAYAAYLAKKVMFSESLDEDETDEYERMLKKLAKQDYRLDKFYPDSIKIDANIDDSDACYGLLLHSGLLHLEKIISNGGKIK